MVIEELLCGVLREGEGVDELEDRLLFFQLSVFIAALVENGDDLKRRFQDFRQTSGILASKSIFGRASLTLERPKEMF